MRLLLLIGAIVLLLGPLRPWFGRHWAFLLSVTAGAVGGFICGVFAIHMTGIAQPWVLPACVVIGAIAAGGSGPEWLRHIEKDGKKNDKPPRRH